jgi:diguanylate cyclase (GGDEF)-like protein
MANRAHFMDELHRAIEAGDTEPVTVMFLDLDDFKLINDSFGHSAGDQFLVEVAGRIGATLGDHGELARFGGDEFTILLASGTEPGMAGCVAEGIIDRLRRPYVIHGHAITARASIGIASTEAVPRSAESLIQAADTALYQVKANGGNAWATYTPGMSTEVRERLVIESRLHRAVAEDELRLLYQPIVDLRDGRLVGAEALVRWQHPELGEIAPDRFLPVAEVAGVIARIDQWVLRQACLQAARWRSVAPLTVSVNVARHWIRHGNLVQAVREALDETGLPAAAIRLEITEGVTAREGAAFLPQLLELRDLGVRMSVDDFGTGESSLAALRRYPVDMLKIDRSFTLGLDEADAGDARAVIRAVVGIGQALGLEVVAEGIETPAQLEAMRDLGCRFGQGFLFGRPAAADAITAMLDRPVRALSAEPVAITASAAAAAAEE